MWEELSERLNVIKEAKGLLYCDGLVSSRLVGKVGLGVETSETLFISGITGDRSPPLVSGHADYMFPCLPPHPSLSLSLSSSHFHKSTEPQFECISCAVCESATLTGMQGPVEICSLTE